MFLFISLLAVPGTEEGANTTLINTNKYMKCEVLSAQHGGGGVIRGLLNPSEDACAVYKKPHTVYFKVRSLTHTATESRMKI